MLVDARQYMVCSPSPVARRLLWHVLGIGRVRHLAPIRYEPFGRPGAVLLWVESGSASLQLGGRQWRLEPGPAFWLFNLDRPRTFTPGADAPLVIRTVRFSGPTLHAWLDELGARDEVRFDLNPAAARAARAAHGKLWRLARAASARWEWRAHLLLLGELLYPLADTRRVFARAADADLPAPITAALDALGANPFHDWTVTELAAVANMTESTFRRLFRAHLRETAHEHLQRRRADLAQSLLSDPRLQIKVIAHRLHFRSDDYFSYFFRRQTGMTPTEFRERLGVAPGHAASNGRGGK